MINVTLKVKHFYYIADLVSALPSNMFFKLLKKMATACDGKDREDYATVETSVEEVERIYSMLSSKPEGETNMLNTEMNQVLLGQMQDNIALGSEEWLELAQKIQTIRNHNWARTDAAIDRGEQFLTL